MGAEMDGPGEGDSGRLETGLAARLVDAGERSVRRGSAASLALGVLGGVWLSLGVNLLLVAGSDSRLGYGPGQLLSGLAFCVGPVLVLLAGGELFALNPLPVMAWLGGRVRLGEVCASAAWVFAGNLVGGVGMVLPVFLAGQYLMGGGAVGSAAVTAAGGKCLLPFWVALSRGLLGGILVCLAGWLSWRAETTAERVPAAVLPFAALTACGFEYCAVNMHLVPLGMALQGAVGTVDPSLSVSRFVLGNLLPVTVGNCLGAVLAAAGVYWAVCVGPDGGGRHGGEAADEAPGGEERRPVRRTRVAK